MKKEHANILLFILVLVIAFFAYENFKVKDELSQKKYEYQKFYENAKKIASLKMLKKNQKRVIMVLSSIKKPIIKQKQRSTVYIFENLNLYKLNRLLRKIQSSYLAIKKINIKRDTTNHASLLLEVAK